MTDIIKKVEDENDENKKDNKKKDDKGIIDNNIYLFDKVCQSSALSVIKKINKINTDNESKKFTKVKEINLHVCSGGGSCNAGFAIIDAIQSSKLPINIKGTGIIASMGLMILMTPTKGTRSVTKSTQIMSHTYSTSMGGTEHNIQNIVDTCLKHLKTIILNHYKKSTGLTKKVIESELLPEKDIWLTPTMAKKYNLIDVIK